MRITVTSTIPYKSSTLIKLVNEPNNTIELDSLKLIGLIYLNLVISYL